MKKLFLFLFVLSLFSKELLAQIYSRPSITPVYVNFRSGVDYSKSADSVFVPEKYDYNFFGSNVISVNIPMTSPAEEQLTRLQSQLSSLLSSKSTSPAQIKEIRAQIVTAKRQVEIDDSIRGIKIFEVLQSERVPNKILASLLVDESAKVMSLDKMAKRAEYNASDADFIKAMNSEAKMSAIRDKGVALLSNVYIIVFDTKSSAEKGVVEGKPELKGYSNIGRTYLYKIDIDTLAKTGQFDDLIFTEPNQAKYNAFKNFNFPVKLILAKSFIGTATNFTIEAESAKNMAKAMLNKNSGQDLVKYIMKSQENVDKEMVTSMLSNADFSFTKDYKPFQVKVSVFAPNPIQAKIGAKESLSIDDLYKVTENVQKGNEVVEKKIGWVRAKKVIDNRKNADGKTEPSTFYKVGSKKVEKGMKLTQVPEKGIILSAGYAMLGSKDEKGNNTSAFSGAYISVDYVTHVIPGLRAGITLGGLGSRLWAADKDNGQNLYAALTAQKIIQVNRIELTPLVGAYINMAEIDKNGSTTYTPSLTYTAIGGMAGFKFGLNLGKHTQLNVGYNLGFAFTQSLKDEDGDEWDQFFNKNANALSIGLRLFGF